MIEKIAAAKNSKVAPETFYIKISDGGPYMVYGNPPLDQEIIVPNQGRGSWSYRKGMKFKSSEEPMCLCRCGDSHDKPFCDGAHGCADWDPEETAPKNFSLAGADVLEGPSMVLIDNEEYCAFARFCDARGRVWNIVQKARTEEEKELVRHEAGHCPAGRLLLWDKEKDELYEPDFDPSIGIVEDPGIKVSGPIWVKGGIRIESADGKNYEVRNRVTLCRCGQSGNKPFCDGTHASMHFQDHLPLN